ncbi:hypothetical protein [uncultured Tateyamaria sp.]|uniref:hypothetical protein n=1 Tax=uncultured Tateyamaria sp. TaxID=455651 RepID=UPI00261FA4BE|nr:hypothetical protein [uncultured Tateyamaria sp.]
MKTALLIVFAMLGSFAGLFWFAITGPERTVQQRETTPEGLRVILVDFPSDPNIVSFDPAKISAMALQDFATSLCGHGTRSISELQPTLFDKLRGHNRAEIICS